MSSTLDFCCWDGVEPAVEVFEEPKISARRSWLDWAVAGCATLGPELGVTEMSSPRRSPWRGISDRILVKRNDDLPPCPLSSQQVSSR